MPTAKYDGAASLPLHDGHPFAVACPPEMQYGEHALETGSTHGWQLGEGGVGNADWFNALI
jgi:hypothetical protein